MACPPPPTTVTEGPAAAMGTADVRAGRTVARDLDVEALYRRYGDMVLGRCRLLLGNDADAQECAQDVFLKAHRHRDQFRGDAAPSTWLFQVTTTTCLNWLRTRRRRREDLVEELPGAASNDSILDVLVVREVVDAVLAEEDERTRLCLMYTVVDGMTQDEAGAMLGLTGAAVRKRVAEFRRRWQEPPAWLGEEP